MAQSGDDLVVMGIDPSLTSTGYAIINFKKNKFKALDYGTIKTQPKQNLSNRLAVIFNSITNLLTDYKPEEIAVEDVFYAKNPKIALMMGHARGASLVAVANLKVPVATYSAREIKMAVSGYGNASKEQIRRMVITQVEINNSNIEYDISDAFAVAICHFFRRDKKLIKVKIDSTS